MTSVIHTDRLTKTYGAHRGITDLDLDVEEGEIFGFLGPNGAGKTTTIKMLATLLEPDAGHATIEGHDVVRDAARVRPIVNMIAGGERSLYAKLTGRENLWYFAELYDLRRDPFQWVNLVDRPRYAGVVRLLAVELDRLRDCAGAECAAPLAPALRGVAPAPRRFPAT